MKAQELIEALGQDSNGGLCLVVYGRKHYLEGISKSADGGVLLWASRTRAGEPTDEELSAYLGFWAPRNPDRPVPAGFFAGN